MTLSKRFIETIIKLARPQYNFYFYNVISCIRSDVFDLPGRTAYEYLYLDENAVDFIKRRVQHKLQLYVKYA